MYSVVSWCIPSTFALRLTSRQRAYWQAGENALSWHHASMQGWWKFICVDIMLEALISSYLWEFPPPHSGQHTRITPIYHTSLSYSLRGRWTPHESILTHYLYHCLLFVVCCSLSFVILSSVICHVSLVTLPVVPLILSSGPMSWTVCNPIYLSCLLPYSLDENPTGHAGHPADYRWVKRSMIV